MDKKEERCLKIFSLDGAFQTKHARGHCSLRLKHKSMQARVD